MFPFLILSLIYASSLHIPSFTFLHSFLHIPSFMFFPSCILFFISLLSYSFLHIFPPLHISFLHIMLQLFSMLLPPSDVILVSGVQEMPHRTCSHAITLPIVWNHHDDRRSLACSLLYPSMLDPRHDPPRLSNSFASICPSHPLLIRRNLIHCEFPVHILSAVKILPHSTDVTPLVYPNR
jgi:hypothetical protein